MDEITSRRFREMYASLPKEVRLHAARAYRLFRHNPSHPGLRFKMVDAESRMYSARVGLGFRALGLMEGDDIVLVWIGSHTEYDKTL